MYKPLRQTIIMLTTATFKAKSAVKSITTGNSIIELEECCLRVEMVLIGSIITTLKKSISTALIKAKI
jgi:hypothetical protein